MKNNGCAFGKVTREKTKNMEIGILEIKGSIGELGNHYSQRLPAWASWT